MDIQIINKKTKQITSCNANSFDLLEDDWDILPENYSPEPTREEIDEAQRKIKELQAEMIALRAQKVFKPKEEEEQPDAIPQELKEQYNTLFGKYPHHRMSESSIREAIKKQGAEA